MSPKSVKVGMFTSYKRACSQPNNTPPSLLPLQFPSPSFFLDPYLLVQVKWSLLHTIEQILPFHSKYRQSVSPRQSVTQHSSPQPAHLALQSCHHQQRNKITLYQIMEAADAIRNRDLIRHLLQQSSDSVRLLKASREIRDNEPCSRHFENWSVEGCPQEPSVDERVCLDGIGRDSAFCTGIFLLKHLDSSSLPVTLDILATALVHRVSSLIPRQQGNDTRVMVSFETTSILFDIGNDSITLTVGDGDITFPGFPCDTTHAEAINTIATLLTRTGRVEMPCPEHTALIVPRRIGVRVSRRDDDDEWLLFTAARR